MLWELFVTSYPRIISPSLGRAVNPTSSGILNGHPSREYTRTRTAALLYVSGPSGTGAFNAIETGCQELRSSLIKSSEMKIQTETCFPQEVEGKL